MLDCRCTDVLPIHLNWREFCLALHMGIRCDRTLAMPRQEALGEALSRACEDRKSIVAGVDQSEGSQAQYLAIFCI